jgi:DNA-directed RNA polymerase subunit RPC12/RpoP
MQGKPYDELTSIEAQHTERNYVCAQCWGQLITQPSRGKDHKCFTVLCKSCGEDRGFVTREYAERRKAEDRADANEARRNLGEALGIKREPFDLNREIERLYPGG